MRVLERFFRIPPRRILGALSAVMLLLSGARFIQSPPCAADDQTSNWWPVVNALLDGKGFTECLPEYFPFCTADSPSAMREPLPLLVHAGVAWVSGRSLIAACVFQVLLNILALWLLYLLGKRLLGERAGIIAAMIWTFYLPAYVAVLNIGGDQTATVLLLFAALSFERACRGHGWKGLLLTGALFGLAGLSRSASVAFGISAGLSWLFLNGIRGIKRQLVGAAALACGAALAFTPWTVRNYLVFDKLVVGSTLSGYNLLRHNSAITGDDYFHFVAVREGRAYLDAFMAAHPELTGEENEAEMNMLYAAAGKEVIAAHPVRYVKLSVYRSAMLWFNWRVNDAYGKPSNHFDDAMALQQGLLLVLMVLGVFVMGAGKWPITLGVLFYCLLYMAVVARVRFLVPAMPFVIILSAAFIARMPGIRHGRVSEGGHA